MPSHDIYTLIDKTSKENEVDLIALATHGYSTLGQLVWGSVAESVVRNSGLPVLIIKAQE